MLARTIPKTGELVPAIGLGTWQTFDVPAAARAPLEAVLSRFLDGGGRVIDSSPMYGRAEETTGDLLERIRGAAKPFLATKVWTRGRREGIAEMERSMRRMRTTRMDLMQIHNLLDWRTHLPVLREWKRDGRIRYIGITHYAHSAFAEMESILANEDVDFVQLPYSVVDRAAEKRLLPAAQAAGAAVLVMRPFDEGGVFSRVRGKALPAWAAELGCTSWASLALKFLVSHPAVTCPIPATSSAAHLAENLEAGAGAMPDESARRRIAALFD